MRPEAPEAGHAPPRYATEQLGVNDARTLPPFLMFGKGEGGLYDRPLRRSAKDSASCSAVICFQRLLARSMYQPRP